jgi:hypothetical protein
MSTKKDDQISSWCWRTGQFLFYFDQRQQSEHDKKLYYDFLSELEKNSFNFRNQGVLLMLCYGLIVYPRERWINEIDYKLNEHIVKVATKMLGKQIENPLDLFELPLNENKQEFTKDTLKHLRNAIAHAQIDVNIDDNTFTFTDRTFSAKITVENLGVFLSGVGRYFIELEAMH